MRASTTARAVTRTRPSKTPSPTAGAARDDVRHALRVFRALSDPNRLELIRLLREGEQCVCDLSDAIGASQPLLSFHLKTLKEAGLVTDRRDGRWVYYALSAAAVDQVQRLLSDVKPTPAAHSRAPRRCD
jgi:ArsR family transcriptional regulator, arsenate/arsenite/antimonite-responsive transcriptional repressor